MKPLKHLKSILKTKNLLLFVRKFDNINFDGVNETINIILK